MTEIQSSTEELVQALREAGFVVSGAKLEKALRIMTTCGNSLDGLLQKLQEAGETQKEKVLLLLLLLAFLSGE
jgi:hypothetical protein